MDRFTADAADALRGYEDAAQRRTRWPPMPLKPLTGLTWAPTMTEAERKEFEQYVIDNRCPF